MFTNNEIAGYFRFDHKQEKRAVKYWETAVRHRHLKSLTLTILDSIKKVAELAPFGGNLPITLSKEKIQTCDLWECHLKEFLGYKIFFILMLFKRVFCFFKKDAYMVS